jgi:hypothetical protein
MSDKTKRCVHGEFDGRFPLLNERTQGFIWNVLAHQDIANEGSNVQEAIDIVQEMDGTITEHQTGSLSSHTRILLKGGTTIIKK